MTDLSTLRESLPHFSAIASEKILPTVQTILTNNKNKIAQLLAENNSYTWNNLMAPLEELDDHLAKVWSPISHLHSVMESESLRLAYNNCLPILTAYHTDLLHNEKLFNAISSLKTSSDYPTFNDAERKIIADNIRDFKLAGVHLSPEKKAEMEQLEKKLSQLTTQFSENVLDATHAFTLHILQKEKLAGLPTQALHLAEESAKEKNLPGYLITLDYPSYSSAIKFLDDRQLRKTLYEAYVTRASELGPNANRFDNTTIMHDILTIRLQIAQLVGFKNYAEYSLVTKMAKKPQEVLDFLTDLLHRSKAVADKEWQEVFEFAAHRDHLTTLESWDFAYYSEKLSETQFHFSQEDLRPFFTLPKVLNGLFSLVQQLFGITVVQEKNIDTWHPDVAFYSLKDDQGQLRGGFYIDLYARAHKREGAWMDDCLSRRILPNQKIQLPVAFLTCNFMPPLNNQPALLNHDEVLTLFHEFGHCLQHMLTQVNYVNVGGIHGIPWDAVEFPSQFMENWCWEKKVIKEISGHFATGEPLPDELYKKMLTAKHFQTGLQMVRQIEFSLFDFKLHLEFDPSKKNQIAAVLAEVRKETSVAKVPEFNRFQNSFAHIFAGGYAAGYYSYKWAEVLSSDAYAKFEENNLINPAVGYLFREKILESGGVYEPLDLFVAFRGRKPTIDALLRHSGLT